MLSLNYFVIRVKRRKGVWVFILLSRELYLTKQFGFTSPATY